MRPIIKGPIPQCADGKEVIFIDYSHSRRYLINIIGEYCSYCERKIESGLAVEHVQPKDTNPLLKLEWDNFLLACTNCNSTKGNTPIIIQDYFWPDTDNTFNIFAYDSGIVKVAKHIVDPISIKKAIKTIELVGLNKTLPKTGSANWEKASDRRYEHRMQALKTALDYREKYEKKQKGVQKSMRDCIKTIVIHQGFWSIWMRAFENSPEVQTEILSCLPGTNKVYFSKFKL